MSDDLIGPTIYAHGEIRLPPAAHNFTLPELSLKALCDHCYLVERKHYDKLVAERDDLRRDNDALRALLTDAVTIGGLLNNGVRERIDTALAQKEKP